AGSARTHPEVVTHDRRRKTGRPRVDPGAAGRESRSRPRFARRSPDHRVRRLRVPVLAAGVLCDRAGRTAAREERAVRVPAFPLTRIHPRALAAAAAAEAAALHGRFWDMHELLFHPQKALGRPPARVRRPAGAWTWRHSTATGPAGPCWSGSSATSTAACPRAGCSAPPPCSSTASCTAAATTRPPCWRHWRQQGDKKPRRSLTMIAVTRPAVITLLMLRMLFTPLGTP